MNVYKIISFYGLRFLVPNHLLCPKRLAHQLIKRLIVVNAMIFVLQLERIVYQTFISSLASNPLLAFSFILFIVFLCVFPFYGENDSLPILM